MQNIILIIIWMMMISISVGNLSIVNNNQIGTVYGVIGDEAGAGVFYVGFNQQISSYEYSSYFAQIDGKTLSTVKSVQVGNGKEFYSPTSTSPFTCAGYGYVACNE